LNCHIGRNGGGATKPVTTDFLGTVNGGLQHAQHLKQSVYTMFYLFLIS